MIALVPAVAGALIVAGIIGLVLGLIPAPVRPPRARSTRRKPMSTQTKRLLLAGVAGGCVAWLVTGWALALVAVPLACVGMPMLLSNSSAAARIDRLEAMEEWTRSLSGVLTVGIGLEQALVATERSTPTAIRPEVQRLVARLRSRWNTEEAIRAFADELDDATGDLVAAKISSSLHAVEVPDSPRCWRVSPSRSLPMCGLAVRSRPTEPSPVRPRAG